MDICTNHDGESIAYVGRTCPACKQVERLQEEISSLKDDVNNLEKERDDLQEQLDNAE